MVRCVRVLDAVGAGEVLAVSHGRGQEVPAKRSVANTRLEHHDPACDQTLGCYCITRERSAYSLSLSLSLSVCVLLLLLLLGGGGGGRGAFTPPLKGLKHPPPLPPSLMQGGLGPARHCIVRCFPGCPPRPCYSCHATHAMLQLPCCKRHATQTMLHTPCYMCHATCAMLQLPCYTRHATCATP